MTSELTFHPWPPSRGGQHTKPTTGMIAVHVRTGLAVACTSEPSRQKNAAIATAKLVAVLEAWADDCRSHASPRDFLP